MCIRDRGLTVDAISGEEIAGVIENAYKTPPETIARTIKAPVSYTHLRAHETVLDLVCRLLLAKQTHNRPPKWSMQ